jgi:16S rRNA processing protein RimM
LIEYLEIGEIVNTHGVKGELKVIPLTDNPERYNYLTWVYIDKNGLLERFDIESARIAKGNVLLKLKGIDNSDAAVKLKGLYLKVNRENAVKLPEGSYFICDLVGCEVIDIVAGKLGILADVLKTGSNDVYVVSNETNSGKEILIPALKEIVIDISTVDKKITISLPKGLLDNEI